MSLRLAMQVLEHECLTYLVKRHAGSNRYDVNKDVHELKEREWSTFQLQQPEPASRASTRVTQRPLPERGRGCQTARPTSSSHPEGANRPSSSYLLAKTQAATQHASSGMGRPKALQSSSGIPQGARQPS